MECLVRPVPTMNFSASVTDVIAIWMADAPAEGFAARIEQLNREHCAELSGLFDLPFYWIDFGGSNNVTTRLRKNPGRQLVRQFDDRARLLERNRSYRLTLVQQHGFVEFWVDGIAWIRQYDASPLTTGHVGFRAFCADLEVRELCLWRIQE